MAPAESKPLGLIEFTNSKESAVEFIADICFVYGLEGGRETTWTSNNICWPKHLLPKNIPNARVFSFGYAADVASFGKVSQNNVEQHANDLAGELIQLRGKEGAVRTTRD